MEQHGQERRGPNEDTSLEVILTAFRVVDDYNKMRSRRPRPNSFVEKKPFQIRMLEPEKFITNDEVLGEILGSQTVKEVRGETEKRLKSVGIKLVLEGDDDPKKIPVTIGDISTFVGYMHKHISKEMVKKDKNVQSLLLSLLERLCDEIRQVGGKKETKGELTDRMIGVHTLLDEFNRYDLSKNANYLTFLDKIKEYSEWYDENSIYENMLVRSMNLDWTFEKWMREPAESTPLSWHDAPNTLASFTNEWDKAVSVLKEIKHIEPLFSNVLKKLERAVDVVQSEIENKSSYGWTSLRREQFGNFLADMAVELKKIEFES